MRDKRLPGRRLLRGTFWFFGSCFIICCLLAFTSAPFWMYYRLGTSTSEYQFKPETIVILGGSGMPSEQNLLRCYTGAILAKKYPDASITIALARNQKGNLYSSSAWMMKQELVQRGIDSLRISLETKGKNTHEQAINILRRTSAEKPIVLITSPEHMYRSLLTFRKAGAVRIGGEAAFERALEAELSSVRTSNDERSSAQREPDTELQLRYQFWNHLKYQVVCYREYVAICYYKLKGWV